jgi:hypothetical protein
MPWSFLQLEILPEDSLVMPMVGPGGLSRTAAHAEVQGILDRIPALTATAAIWRRGARDDTVFFGPFTWAIFEYAGDDPMPAAKAWIEDYADTMRGTGLDVQIGWPQTHQVHPEEGP